MEGHDNQRRRYEPINGSPGTRFAPAVPKLTQGVMDQILVNEREAARLLGVCEKTLYNLRTEGRVPHLRLGSRVLYSPDALKKWVESQLTTNGKRNYR